MNANSKKDLDSRLRYLSDRLREEFEVVERQGFPSRKAYSPYGRRHDVYIDSSRWWKWANELGIDYNQLEDLMEILKGEGLLEEYKFVSEFM